MSDHSPFFPPTYHLDIDSAHERRLRREAKLESEGREMDRDWPEFDESEQDD